MIHFAYKSVNPPDSATFRTDLNAAKRSRRSADRAWRKSGLTVHKQIFDRKNFTILFSVLNKCSSALVLYMQGTVRHHNYSDRKFKRNTSSHKHVSLKNKQQQFANFFTDKTEDTTQNLHTILNIHIHTNPPSISISLSELLFFSVSEKAVFSIRKKMPQKSSELDSMPTSLV